MKKKVLIIVFAIAFIFNSSIFLSFASSGETLDTENIVIPQVDDFTYSGTTLTGLSTNYANSLTDQQKQNIVLQIPAKTTAIGNDAFWMSKTINKPYRFISLDFSQVTNLQQIGSNAFYGCSYLTGDLIIPDTVTSIGTHAFDGCKSLTGQLHLSNQLTTISDYAFYNCGFTGQLTLPDQVVSIGNSAFRQSSSYQGFTGNLKLPDTLQSLGGVAFAYQSGITSTNIPSLLTQISDSAFKGTGINGTLYIPDTIQSIGSSSFAETHLEIVYLPKRIDENNANFIQSTSFNTTSISALICDKEDYSHLYNTLNSTTKSKLGYELDVKFIDSDNSAYDVIHCLYNRPYAFQNKEGTWKTIPNYTFPTVKNKPNQKWGLTSTSVQPVSETSLVSKDSLYAIDAWQDATFTYSDGIDQVYDGNPTTLSVHASHPLAKPIGQAKIGDIVFYYTWSWGTIGSSPSVAKGFDVNTYDVTDVRMPDYTIGCDVQIQTCMLQEKNGKTVASQIAVTTHTFSVHLQQAEPNVNPIVDTQKRLVAQGLPDIALSSGDTSGTIHFDEGQALQLGVHTYSWTFIPADNDVGNSNYKVKHGEVEIEAVDKFSYTVNATLPTHGKIHLDKSVFNLGEDVTIGFKADIGYCLDHVYLDNQDITKEIVNDHYILKNIQKDCTIKATFKRITSLDFANEIDELPDIHGSDITNDERITILETVANYLDLKSNSEEISQEDTAKLYNVLAQLPQINIEVNQQFVHLDNHTTLLESLSLTDINELLSNQDAKCQISMEVQEAKITPIQTDQINKQLKNIDIIKTFDISIMKNIKSQTVITTLNKPIALTFDIPQELPTVANGYTREFFIIRFHDNGTTSDMKVFKDEDNDANTISIHTDRFSTYVLGYRDVNNELEEQGKIEDIVDESTSSLQNNTIQPRTSIETGDQTPLQGSIVLCLATMSLIAILLLTKKHN